MSESSHKKTYKGNKPAKQMNGTQEGKLLFLRHSAGLQGGLFDKSQFPSSEGWSSSVEDEIIPLLPNLPGSNYISFHEEIGAKLAFCFLHHSMEAKIKSPMNTQVIPASLAEGAAKEQVKDSFLTMSGAQHTTVVIVLEFMLFSSEDVSHIKSVHQQEPREYP
jgi:hypothetical protein